MAETRAGTVKAANKAKATSKRTAGSMRIFLAPKLTNNQRAVLQLVRRQLQAAEHVVRRRLQAFDGHIAT